MSDRISELPKDVDFLTHPSHRQCHRSHGRPWGSHRGSRRCGKGIRQVCEQPAASPVTFDPRWGLLPLLVSGRTGGSLIIVVPLQPLWGRRHHRALITRGLHLLGGLLLLIVIITLLMCGRCNGLTFLLLGRHVAASCSSSSKGMTAFFLFFLEGAPWTTGAPSGTGSRGFVIAGSNAWPGSGGSNRKALKATKPYRQKGSQEREARIRE